MALSRRIIVSSFLLLFAIPSQSRDLICPTFEEPGECPRDDHESSLCQPEGKTGSASGCPPGLICCNTGCQFLDCVVPEVNPNPTQPQKVMATEDLGNKNVSDLICPTFEEPGECPRDDHESSLCQPEGKTGSASGCPPGLICCNTGCQFLDCVVPEVNPNPTQPQKVMATEDLGNKNVSGKDQRYNLSVGRKTNVINITLRYNHSKALS
ncbi:uncharacterized protein LOC111337214 [Stylophora pistillata]|uniref:uncharacterized protein LOC111337214 n=1 Tax=Stylophora pistillata TaxID=50429 RepID=UPI000C055287|nr:uncharacterized protein LOC111337214 [Stylophora pistillata]